MSREGAKGNEGEPTWWERHKDALLKREFYQSPQEHEKAWESILNSRVDLQEIYDTTADYERDEKQRRRFAESFELDIPEGHIQAKRNAREFLTNLMIDLNQRGVSTQLTFLEFVPYLAGVDAFSANQILQQILIGWREDSGENMARALRGFVDPKFLEDAEDKETEQDLILLQSPLPKIILSTLGLKL